jgi:thymidylate kinase
MQPKALRLITFSGIDGSGKSTIAKKLLAHFSDLYNIPVHYVWCKFGELRFRKYNGADESLDIRHEKTLIKTNSVVDVSLLKTMYFNLLMIFHLWKIYSLVALPLRRNEIVICDRYIYDTYVDIEQESKIYKRSLYRLLNQKWLPQPKWRYLLDINETNAKKRKQYPKDGYLSKRQSLYLRIAENYDIKIIDANLSVDSLVAALIGDIDFYNTSEEK